MRIVIGIDPGVNTGFATYNLDDRKLITVETLMIHQAMGQIQINQTIGNDIIMVRVEDARKRMYFDDADARMTRSGAGIREGVGSVKRDCTIWEDFLKDLGVPFEMVKPAKGATKYKASAFMAITKWKERTSEHSRDAAMLVWQWTPKAVIIR